MLPYWLLFGYFALGALISRGIFQTQQSAGIGPMPAYASVTPPNGRTPAERAKVRYPLLGIGLFIIIFMAGLRYRVGGDWGSYAFMFRQSAPMPYLQAIQLTDPGYQTVSWLVAQTGAGVWLVNVICACIFAWGLGRLVRREPLPWLAISVAVPYLVIVVAMGYTRQAAAIGFLMSGAVSLLERGSPARFLVYGVLATLFHKTAFLTIPMVLLGSGQARLFVVLTGLIIAAILFQYFVAGALPRLTRDYIDAGYQSKGAGVRLALTTVCGATLLLFKSRMGFDKADYRLWRNFAFASFVLLGGLFYINSSTVIDRLGLYLYPLQIVVLGRVPLLVRNDVIGKIAVVTLSALVLFVWANFGANSFYWNPYHLVPMSVLGATT